MQITTTAAPAAAPPVGQAPTTGVPVGASRMSRVYWDAAGVQHRCRFPVPVNDFGQMSATGWLCPKCSEPYWLTGARAAKPGGVQPAPVCRIHNRRMTLLPLRRPPLLPWAEIRQVVERPLRPVWGLSAMAAVGALVDAAAVPAVGPLLAAPAAGEAARRVVRWWRVSRAVKANRLDGDDPQAHKRRRAAIDRAARKVGYAAAAGAGWLSMPAWLGVDSPVTWAGLLAVWLPAAATWWWMDRNREQPRPAVEVLPVESDPEVDPEEAAVRRRWREKISCRQGDVIGRTADGHDILAKRDGRLPGARLTDWQPVKGGWQATIRGPVGEFDSDQFAQSKVKIAAAFQAARSMVTLLPDQDDENVATVLVQRAAVVAESVRWTGPDSIDALTGLAPLVQYVDGTIGMYELYRPGWGVPHEFFCGTTGSGKSEALNGVFAIDRWAHHDRVGLVCDFLIDPQQGQSFGAFADDLAAPVASTFEEAMLLVEAFIREMRRRNRYLSRVEWTDEKGRKRRGRKWWNPLVDGPLLCLNIDEAHEFLAVRKFAQAITASARMFRKCGMKIRIATHTPLLTDLGGSMALRDMLTGGFVWCGRTANSLTKGTAFNGRLAGDPRSIPEVAGACFILSAHEKKPMMARTMWEPDYYDWVRDESGQPIGFPGVLPAETLDAFGPEYARWVETVAAGADWLPDEAQAERLSAPDGPAQEVVDALLDVLAEADGPLGMDGLDAALRERDVAASTLAVRAALRVLRDAGAVASVDRRHVLTAAGRGQVSA